MKIHLATDHAGFELKEQVLAYARDTLGHEVLDHGAAQYDAIDDYPAFIAKAAKAVSDSDGVERAIIFGGSGQGEAMVANRFAHVRATTYYSHNLEIIKLSREHNDANVLSIGARFISFEQAKEAIDLWLATPLSGVERHARRVAQIEHQSQQIQHSTCHYWHITYGVLALIALLILFIW